MRFLNAVDFKNLKENPKFNQNVNELYSTSDCYDYQLKRYQDLYKIHAKFYPNNVLMFSSPGRIEICGNHTDHNNGKVICASISLDTIACVTPTDDYKVTVASVGYPPLTVDLNDLVPYRSEYGTSEALVRGVAAYLKENGYNIGGFYATTTSDVFKGAGVSSSACFEVLLCEIFNALFNEGKIAPLTKVFASHCAESQFFGKPCGLMDQSAIAFGNVSYIDFIDPKQPLVETIDWTLENVQIFIINCGGDHCNLTPEYAAIRGDMEAVAMGMGKKVLRETKESVFYASMPKLKTMFNTRQLLRATHFYNENKRVTLCCKALKAGKFPAFSKVINASGESSYDLLQNVYVSGSLDQPMAFALMYMRQVLPSSLACRVHGGGFAGTIIGFTARTRIKFITRRFKTMFGEESVHVVRVRKSGTKVLDL